MTREALQHELQHLEEVSEDIFGTTPTFLSAATKAAKAGDLKTCLDVIDHAIPVFSQADAGQLSSPLMGIFKELRLESHAA